LSIFYFIHCVVFICLLFQIYDSLQLYFKADTLQQCFLVNILPSLHYHPVPSVFSLLLLLQYTPRYNYVFLTQNNNRCLKQTEKKDFKSCPISAKCIYFIRPLHAFLELLDWVVSEKNDSFGASLLQLNDLCVAQLTVPQHQ